MTKKIKHSSLCNTKTWWSSVEMSTLRLSSCDNFNIGSLYLNVALMTMHHLHVYNGEYDRTWSFNGAHYSWSHNNIFWDKCALIHNKHSTTSNAYYWFAPYSVVKKFYSMTVPLQINPRQWCTITLRWIFRHWSLILWPWSPSHELWKIRYWLVANHLFVVRQSLLQ